MLDRLSPVTRHALILLLGAVLTYASSNIPALPAQWQPLVGAVVTILSLVVTPLTRQYGVGAAVDGELDVD